MARVLVGTTILVGRAVIGNSECRVQTSQALIKRLYGLTVDEAEEERSISRNTARCQLRAIFAKTGVTRRTELLRLLLRGVIPLA